MASKIKVDQIAESTVNEKVTFQNDVIVPTGKTITIADGVPVASGGTGLASFTAGDVLYATGSTTLAKLPKGTAEQILSMNSGATLPEWTSADISVLPTITVAKGGTNLESFTAGDILYATGATTLAKLAKGTAAQTLKMNAGATAPEWTTVAAASSDYVLITGVEVSGTPTTIDLQGCFTATYDNYILRWNGLKQSGSYPLLSLLDSSNNHLGSNTYYAKTDVTTDPWVTYGHFYTANSSANGWRLNYDYAITDDNGGYGECTFWNPLSTSAEVRTTWQSSFSNSAQGSVGFTCGTGKWDGTKGAATGISFRSFSGSATFLDIGNVALYGIKHS